MKSFNMCWPSSLLDKCFGGATNTRFFKRDNVIWCRTLFIGVSHLRSFPGITIILIFRASVVTQVEFDGPGSGLCAFDYSLNSYPRCTFNTERIIILCIIRQDYVQMFECVISDNFNSTSNLPWIYF